MKLLLLALLVGACAARTPPAPPRQYGLMDDALEHLITEGKKVLTEKVRDILKDLIRDQLGVYGITDDIKNALQEMLGNMKETLVDEAIRNIRENVIDKIRDIDTDKLVKDALDAFVDSIQRGGKRLGYSAAQYGVLDELRDALVEAAGKMKDKVLGDIVDTVKSKEVEGIETDKVLRDAWDRFVDSIQRGGTRLGYSLAEDLEQAKEDFLSELIDNIRRNVIEKIKGIDTDALVGSIVDKVRSLVEDELLPEILP